MLDFQTAVPRRDPVSGEVESGGEFFGEGADGGPSSTVSGFATGA